MQNSTFKDIKGTWYFKNRTMDKHNKAAHG